MHDIIFDMETGDPDDLITLLMLLNNPEVNLRAITCYQGSPIQIGLINSVLRLENRVIPVGGLNMAEPEELSPYYTDVMRTWQKENALHNPSTLLKNTIDSFPDITLLTGAPLSNIKELLTQYPDIQIKKVVTQGGYIGDLVQPTKKLKKFVNKNSQRTYNLGNDVEAFTVLNNYPHILSLTYVTKDLCHGFCYTSDLHSQIAFGNNPFSQLLKKCLGKYAEQGKSKAMHDPLAMLYMLDSSIGKTEKIIMNYVMNEKNHPVFSSVKNYDIHSHIEALVDYDIEKAWSAFSQLCTQQKLSHKNKI